MSSGICVQRRPGPACASAQSDQGFHYPLSELLDITECMNGEQNPGETLHMRRMIWILAFCTCSKAAFRLTLHTYSEPSLQRQHLIPKTCPLKWICCCTEYLLCRLICKKGLVLLSSAFSEKSEGTWYSAFRGACCVVRYSCCVMRGSEFVVGTLWAQLLLQFWTNPLKLYRCFNHGQKTYMCFLQNA